MFGGDLPIMIISIKVNSGKYFFYKTLNLKENEERSVDLSQATEAELDYILTAKEAGRITISDEDLLTLNTLLATASGSGPVASDSSKEDVVNKVTSILTASNTQYPSTSAVISYVTTKVSSDINTAVTNLIGGAPSTFDTLKEISDWLNGDGVTTAELTASLATKVNASLLGANNGIATLDSSGKLVSTQLPSLTKSTVGLSNVDNTADLNKSVAKSAVAVKLETARSLNGVSFDGSADVTIPVPTVTQTLIDSKVTAVSGKGLSTNDFSTEEKNKLASLSQITIQKLTQEEYDALTFEQQMLDNVLYAIVG